MAKVIDVNVIKKRPVLVGGVVLVGGLIFYFLFLRPRPAQEAESEPQKVGYTDAQVVAASRMAEYQQQAALQGQQIQGQIALAQINAQGELAIANANVNLQREMGALSLEAQRMSFARDIENIQSTERLGMMGMQTSAHIQELTLQTQLQGLQAQMQRDVAMNQMLTDAQINMSAMQAQVSMAGISAQENISRHALDATTAQIKAANELQLGLGAQNVQIKQIEASTAQYTAKQQGSASKSSSKWGAIGSIAGAAIMAFSDINIKSIRGCVSVERCLTAIESMPIDYWVYLDGEKFGEGMHVGTYAQDFYRELGCPDWSERKVINHVDMFGALGGAIKALARERKNG